MDGGLQDVGTALRLYLPPAAAYCVRHARPACVTACHVGINGLFDPHGPFRGQGCVAVHDIGEGRAPDAERLSCIGHGQA